MIALLRERGIRDERVLQAMQSIERHLFVPEPFTSRAYEDSALPIGKGQTISQPYTVAFMTQELNVNEGDRVLEVGTGSGYQATILAALGARVYTIERNLSLLTGARKMFEKMNLRIVAKAGDGTIGWNEFAPFKGIIVTAGAPGIPEPLVKQLSPDGGRLVVPVGDLAMQTLIVLTKQGESIVRREVNGFKFVPLIGKMGWK